MLAQAMSYQSIAQMLLVAETHWSYLTLICCTMAMVVRMNVGMWCLH